MDQPDKDGFCLSCETLFSGDWTAPEWGCARHGAMYSNSLGAGESPNPRNASSEAQQTNLRLDFSKFHLRALSRGAEWLTMVMKTSPNCGEDPSLEGPFSSPTGAEGLSRSGLHLPQRRGAGHFSAVHPHWTPRLRPNAIVVGGTPWRTPWPRHCGGHPPQSWPTLPPPPHSGPEF